VGGCSAEVMQNMGGEGDKTEIRERERDRKWKCQRKTNKKCKISGSHSFVFKK
jgi:hypothetical protein